MNRLFFFWLWMGLKTMSALAQEAYWVIDLHADVAGLGLGLCADFLAVGVQSNPSIVLEKVAAMGPHGGALEIRCQDLFASQSHGNRVSVMARERTDERPAAPVAKPARAVKAPNRGPKLSAVRIAPF